jgi:hypothetical protein
MRRASLPLLIAALLVVGACGGDDTAPSSVTIVDEPAATADDGRPTDDEDAGAQTPGGEVPEVVDVVVTREDGGTHRFDVTVSSPYDRPEKYADAWRIVGSDGTVYGLRELTHDHAAEQPFTRSLDGVQIPAGVGTVVVEARDLVDGWSGQTLEVEVPD